MSKQADEDLNLEVVEYPEGTRFIGPGDDVVISAAVLKANYTPNHLVEQRCLEARIDQLKNVTLKALLGSGEPESIAIILEQIDSLEAQLTNLQNKEEK